MKNNIATRFVNYCKESYDELAHKVSWPSYSELTASAIIVLEASILIAIIVFALDSLFRAIMEGVIYPH